MRRRNEQNESGTETRSDGIYSLDGGWSEARGFSEAENPLNGIRLSEFKNEEVNNKMEECTDGFCPMPTATTVDHNLHFFDPVEKPMHYAAGSVECIDAIEAQLTPEEFRGYLKGNIAKYMWRERKKGGKESLKKARWYLNKLIDLDG
jgi:hypothetical protein